MSGRYNKGVAVLIALAVTLGTATVAVADNSGHANPVSNTGQGGDHGNATQGHGGNPGHQGVDGAQGHGGNPGHQGVHGSQGHADNPGHQGQHGGPTAQGPADKITICHATSSATNPFVVITISENGLNG